LRLVAAIGAILFAVPLTSVASLGGTSVVHAAGMQTTVALINAGTTTVTAPATGSADPQANEIDSTISGDDSQDTSGAIGINRSPGGGNPGNGPSVNGSPKAKSNPELVQSFDGLNFHDQRTANHSNQFSVEPPDQGLCAGNGFVMESVNDVLRIWKQNGTAAIGVTDLNTFYRYPAAIIRRSPPPNLEGPSITDPSCYFDPPTQRWFQVALVLDRTSLTNPALTGTNHLDIAVSNTSDPTGSWTIFILPTQNDGTQGTPDHGCVLRDRTTHGPCLADYPHLGADANGIYISTNEFDFFGPFVYDSQIYAISKQALEAGTATSALDVDAGSDPYGFPAFTVWPAISPDSSYDGAHGGTENFLSSSALFQSNGADNHITITALSNTSSLNSASPNLGFAQTVLTSEPYAVPPLSSQPAGHVPLADCTNNTPPVSNCRALVGGSAASPFTEVEGKLASNDSRIQQVVYANGKLWSALDTGLSINGGAPVAGIAYFVINPHAGKFDRQGYLGIDNNNLNYPAVGVTTSGRGAIAFTLVGQDHFPSAAYASLDDKIGAGDVHVIAEGAGPQDGFTEYHAFSNLAHFRIRPRWGDYGGAVADGNNLWIASEYVGQTCTYSQYLASPFGTCGGTRSALGNWDTRISQLTP
jgi:hypothetical protein